MEGVKQAKKRVSSDGENIFIRADQPGDYRVILTDLNGKVLPTKDYYLRATKAKSVHTVVK